MSDPYSVRCPDCGQPANGAYDSSGYWGRCTNMSAHGTYVHDFEMSRLDKASAAKIGAAMSGYRVGVAARMTERDVTFTPGVFNDDGTFTPEDECVTFTPEDE